MSASPAKKLGLKPGTQVLLLNAPSGVKTVLGDLPSGMTTVTNPAGQYAVVLAFVKSKTEVKA